ncbi:transmembrane protein 65 [Sabethes cyaneus]|uniref:transmembrane protein 65 n=1 Tax=Sabethes cyaneus TaxID=53552 RepID=UPI00237DB1B6|nr:transmembrane protein 65 [Sabethes cyaneus]
MKMSANVSSLSRVSAFVFQQCTRNTSGAAVPIAAAATKCEQQLKESVFCNSSPPRRNSHTVACRSASRTTCRSKLSLKPNSISLSRMFLPLSMASRRPYTQAASTLTREQLHDLVYRLNEDERELLMNTLKQFESNKQKAQFEGQLAATAWRSRFGRPAKLKPALGDVDPTGSYCAVPEDWLQKKFAETVPPPPPRDLFQLGLVNALPFIGFGFLDNFTMIIAGDYIEHTLGLFMCISTMAAAALGNTISDVIGIGSAFYVEKLAEMSGVNPPKLSPIQLEMKSSRQAANMGRVIGITIGCLLGMCPLLFKSDEDKDGKPNEDKSVKADKK